MVEQTEKKEESNRSQIRREMIVRRNEKILTESKKKILKAAKVVK